jgi:hypothetical protein
MLFFGTLNHKWEVTIAFPMVIALLWPENGSDTFDFKQIKYALGVAAVAVLALAINSLIVSQQVQHQPNTVYATHNAGLGWLVEILYPFPDSHMSSMLIPRGPIGFTYQYSFTLSIIFTAGWIVYARKRNSFVGVVMTAWFLSAMSIGVLLARGYVIHNYYIWAQVAPQALTFAFISKWLLRKLTETTTAWPILRNLEARHLSIALAGCLVLSASMYGFVWQNDVATIEGIEGTKTAPQDLYETHMLSNQTETQKAIQKIKSKKVSYASQIAFVGDWKQAHGGKYSKEGGITIAHILMYSDVMIRGRTIDNSNELGATVVYNRSDVNDCELMVVLDNDRTLSVTEC